MDTEIQKKLDALTTDPALQRQVLVALSPKKPTNWGRKSIATYYKPEFAIQFKEELDTLVQTRAPICWYYNIWCDKLNISKDTLYFRVNQSKNFLLQQMDPDGYYTNLWSQIKCWKKPSVGIIVEFKPEFVSEGKVDFKPSSVMPTETRRRWWREMELFLENGNVGVPFHREGICLSPEEIAECKQRLAPLGDSIIKMVTSHEVKIIKRKIIE